MSVRNFKAESQPYAARIKERASSSSLRSPSVRRLHRLSSLFLASSLLCAGASAQESGTYQVTNLISDGAVAAATTDPSFVNPWGVSKGPAFWINTANTGLDYVAAATGKINFRVIIPPAPGASTSTGVPSGTVFSGTAMGNFLLPDGAKALFLFCSLDGIITGWNAGLGTNNSVAQIVVNNSAHKAVYTDMALLPTANGTFILASNFGQGSDIEVYDSNFAPAKLGGSFSDPNLPMNYAPFSVHVLHNQVIVTYALRDANTGRQTVGAGDGIVDVFNTNGNFVTRSVTGGNLNAPWGVAIAPASFGIYSNDLLVGNFGDGIINVYDPHTYAYLGQMIDGTGKALSYPALWEITFGGGGTLVGDPNTLYFAAGLSNGAHGLFGAITNAGTASGTPTFGFSASTSIATVTAGGTTQAIVSAAPTHDFSGTVNLACTGPTGVTCTFSPSQLSVSGSASATSMLTIHTMAGMASLDPFGSRTRGLGGAALAAMLPFGALLAFGQKRRNGLQLLGMAVILILPAALVGCSSSNSMTSPRGTPVGAQMLTVTATSGSITQSTTIALKVQ